MSDQTLPDFVHDLELGAELVKEMMTLPPDVQRELDSKLKEMAECRARAEVSARNYFIGGVA